MSQTKTIDNNNNKKKKKKRFTVIEYNQHLWNSFGEYKLNLVKADSQGLVQLECFWKN